MLEVEAMTFGDLAVDSLLDPGYLIDHLVAELVEDVQSKPILGVDDPDEEESICLDLVKGYLKDLVIRQSIVGNSHTTCGIRR